MRRRLCFPKKANGFTILELLVTISLISLLMTLLLPAVMSARTAARRTQCRNNLRNLGVAMQSELTTNRRFPASGLFSTDGMRYRSWVVTLLPWLERNDIAQQWEYERPNAEMPNIELAQIPVKILVCPDDDTAMPGKPNLSYAVNGGYGWTEPVDCPSTLHLKQDPPLWGVPIDFNGDGVTCPADESLDGEPKDRLLYFRTAVFFPENFPLGSGTVRHHTADTVTDGLSQTLIIAESVRAGYDPDADNQLEVTGWANPEPRRTSFLISGYVCEGLRCSAGRVDYRRANDRTQEPYRFEAINSARDQPEGQAPWATSFHQGGVHVVFGDGHVEFLSESVDGSVYAALASPQGARLRGPLAQRVLSGTDY